MLKKERGDKVENLKSSKKENLEKRFYLKLMENIASKEVKSVSIINSQKHCFVVDKKYEKLCEKIMELYEKSTSSSKKFYSCRHNVKWLCATGLIIIQILNQEKLNYVYAQTPYEEEIINEEENTSIEEEIVETILESIIENSQEVVSEIQTEPEISEQSIYDIYLQEYASYFHFDSDKVIALAKMTTNNYEDFTSIINNPDYNLENPEVACMTFVYLLNKNGLAVKWKDLNCSKKDLLTTEEAETLSYDHIDDLVLKNGQHYSENVSKICDLFGIQDKSMVLAVSYSEIDKDNPNDASRTKNNFSGMMDGNFELITFPTPEAGIICMCGNFKDRYDDYTIDNVEELAGHYVKGDRKVSDNETKGWISNVVPIYYDICENYDLYFSPTEEEIETITLVLTQ